MSTVPIRPNLAGGKPQLNPKFTFWIHAGFTPGVLEWTQSIHRVNTKLTQSGHRNYTPENRHILCVFEINKGQEFQAVKW